MNNFWVLILPGLVSAWNLMIARNYIYGLPMELEEAALMDGAHPLRIAFQIFFPLAKPILAVLCLWCAVGHWNSWYDAMIYFSGKKGVTLQLVLRRLLIVSGDGMNLQMANDSATANVATISLKCATIVVAIFPIMCVYPFLQKYFTKGVTIGAVKG